MYTDTSDYNGSNGGGLTYFQGLIFGGLAGAGLAILFAPRSGQETRDLITQKSEEVLARVNETAAEARAQLNGFARSARTQAEELAKEAKEGAASLQEQGHDLVVSQKNRIERTAEAAKNAAQKAWNQSA